MGQADLLLSGNPGLGLISRITDAMRYLPDQDKTLNEILQVIMSMTPAENCSLMLQKAGRESLVIQAAKGRRDLDFQRGGGAFRRYFRVTEGVAPWVLKTGRALYLADVGRDPRFVEIEESPFTIGSLMCYPVRDGDQTVGILNLSHRQKDAFGDLEDHALKIISNQVAIVLASSGVLRNGALGGNGRDAPQPSSRKTSQPAKDRRVVIPWPGAYRNDKDFQFLYHSEKMCRIMEMIDQVADTDVTVLIHGESGVGKELVARALHFRSTRKEKPFMKINCAALPEELLESELFGYEKGAFTGAYNRKPGKFEMADGGTVFLDEIAEISPSLQAKLLQVLQDGEFARLGGKKDIQVSVRVLVATNKNLEEYVKQGRFREDLYYRLNVLNIHVPPLRERTEEIQTLSRYFLDKYSQKYEKPLLTLSSEACDLFHLYDWPGNVRELENMIKRMIVLGHEEIVKNELGTRLSASSGPEDSPTQRVEEPRPIPLKQISRKAALEAEREVIKRTLEKTHWNRKMAARLLDISYKALLYKIKECGLDSPPVF
jgi:transcriptional regulator with GAF, ATPase, and Fis domain